MIRAALAASLVAVALVAALGAPGSPPSAATDGGEGDPPGHRIYLGNLASDGRPAVASVSRAHAYQGGAVKVAVSDAIAGRARVFGRTYPLLPAGDGIEGFVGFGVLDPAGTATIEVTYTDRTDAEHTEVFELAVLETEWTVEDIWLPPGTGEYLDPAKVEDENALLASIYGGAWTPPGWTGTWMPPISGLNQAMISGYFGEQRSFNGGPVGGHHGGTDIAVPEGMPVHAANAGIVVLARELFVRGNMVIVDHGGGVFSGYAHLSSIAVVEGQAVARGDMLGAVGSTGLSTGPHLHWEMAVAGVLVDGLRWLDGTQGF